MAGTVAGENRRATLGLLAKMAFFWYFLRRKGRHLRKYQKLSQLRPSLRLGRYREVFGTFFKWQFLGILPEVWPKF